MHLEDFPTPEPDFEQFLKSETSRGHPNLDQDILHEVIHNHGSEYNEVLKYIEENPSLAQRLGQSNVIKAELVHSVREEMARKLGDVVFRRTSLASAENPGDACIIACANLMASELGWTPTQVSKELNEVRAILRRLFPSEGSSH